jgi:transposase InsO family protein
MKSMALPKMSTSKPVSVKIQSEQGECKNHLDQRFNPSAPNTVWAGDITYVRVAGRFCYVCVIMDLFSRKVIAWKTGMTADKRLVIDTFTAACVKRGNPNGVLFHSDRGCQYTSKDFRKTVDNADFVQSFSAKGHPYDNAVVESFFKYLKKELTNRHSYSSIKELNMSLFEYVEGFYNKSRPHSSNGMLSPVEKEVAFFNR